MTKNKLNNKNNNSKENLYIKIILAIVMVFIVILGGYYVIELFVINKTSYFTKHFLTSCILFLVGVGALLMPMVSQKKYSGENKGDSLMIVVAFLLFICSLFSIIMSYMG